MIKASHYYALAMARAMLSLHQGIPSYGPPAGCKVQNIWMKSLESFDNS